MLHLVIALAENTGGTQQVPMAVFAFLSISAVALFGIFLPVSTWTEARRREREAYYKAETIRRIAEASGEGAKAAIELLREQDRLRQIRKLEGMKIGGLINMAVGVGTIGMLGAITHNGVLSTVGLIPGLIGVAMLVYVYFLAEPF